MVSNARGARLAVIGCLFAVLALSHAAHADESAIRRTLKQHFPELPTIDEVTKTPVSGLWEVRMGTELVYVDDQASYLIDGHIINARSRENITEARIAKITAIDFSTLPLKDAIVWKQGTGARKMVVFADPNCGYCKMLERNMNSIKDVTVYTFLYPILGGDSPEKSKAIWCSSDKATVWRNWMVGGKTPAPSTACDISALQRNVQLGRKHAVNGTPLLVFTNGERMAGVFSAAELEEKFPSP